MRNQDISNRCIAIIPARGSSKSIPKKNIIDLAGRPLIAYTILSAEKCGIFDRVVVSTDDKKIEHIALKYGAEVIKRPKKLAKDKTHTEPVMLHVLEWLKKKESYKPDVIFLLQPTSPLRNKNDIKKAFKTFIKKKSDSLLSVIRNTSLIWKRERGTFKPINFDYRYRPRRQDMKDQFRANGAIFITRYDVFMKFKNRLGGKIGYYVMNEDRSVEIDEPLDLLVAEQIIKRKNK